jgi:hypothetical protein
LSIVELVLFSFIRSAHPSAQVENQALEITYDPEGLFPDVDESQSSMLIDKKLKAKEAKKAKKEQTVAE